MNPIINSLALIADASEYFKLDWKIRGSLTSSVIWAAASVHNALRQDVAPENLRKRQIVLATLRCWARDSNASGLVLDLTEKSVANTLGVSEDRLKKFDPHAEACRLARQKCMQVRSAVNFKKFYEASMTAAMEQQRQRLEMVDEVANLCSDNGFVLNGEWADAAGFPHIYNHEFISDNDLADEATVEDKLDRMSEVIANVCEAMYDECDTQLASAITERKINALTAHMTSIKQMMEVVGVDTKKLAHRKEALAAQLDAQVAILNAQQSSIGANINAQLDAMQADMAPNDDTPIEHVERRYNIIKSPERIAREEQDMQAAMARQNEDRLAKLATNIIARFLAELPEDLRAEHANDNLDTLQLFMEDWRIDNAEKKLLAEVPKTKRIRKSSNAHKAEA